MKKVVLICGLALAGAFTFAPVARVQAQIDMPAPSPTATLSQKIGLTNVTIAYSRPSAKGRKVFGDLVPFGELWRTGANAATKITFADEVTINNQKVPAGDYSLYTIPTASDWTIVLNKNTKNWGTDGYKQEEDVVRFTVKSEKSSNAVESFTMNIANNAMNSSDIELAWENTLVRFKVTAEVDSRVMEQIKAKTSPKKDAGTYYQAARYYFDTDKDLKQALEWVSKSVELEPERYWVVLLKANIQVKLKDYKGAVETAKKAKDLAAKDNDNGYVRMSQKIIDEYSKK
jgi:tetratricopeptide (TPR) repeat protein